MQRRLKVTLALAVITASTGLFARQQAPAAPASQAGRFTAASAGVLVDVVVRDKKGPVMDLNAEDFTITEDGKPQEVVSFDRRMVADTERRQHHVGAVRIAVDPHRRIALVVPGALEGSLDL